MFIDTAQSRPARTARRTVADRLTEALTALAGGHGEVLAHDERSWASVTFAGARHRVALGFAGPAAIEGAEHLIASLQDHEFAIPGQLVADASVVAVEHVLIPHPRLTVQCELLLVEDA